MMLFEVRNKVSLLLVYLGILAMGVGTGLRRKAWHPDMGVALQHSFVFNAVGDLKVYFETL